MPGTKRLSPCTSGLPVGAPSVVPAGRLVAPPREPAAGGPAGGVMSRNPAFMAALTADAVTFASGKLGVTTVPLLSVGGAPAQRPKPAVPAPPGTATALHVMVGAARITSPLIVVAPVLVTPAVDAIP